MSRPARSLAAEPPLVAPGRPLAWPLVVNVRLKLPCLAMLSSAASWLASLPPTTHVRLSLVLECFWCSLESSADSRSGNGGISSQTVRRRSSVGMLTMVRYSHARCWSSGSSVWLYTLNTLTSCGLISGKRLTNLTKHDRIMPRVLDEHAGSLLWSAMNCSIGLHPFSSAMRCPNSPRM